MKITMINFDFKRVRRKDKRDIGRRGMSLVEVVVSLSLIMVISAAAFSLVLSSSKVEIEAMRSTEITMFADNSYDCFRYAENESEFYELLQKLDEGFVRDSGKFLLEKNNFAIEIIVAEYKNLSFTAYDTDGEKLYSYEFTRG